MVENIIRAVSLGHGIKLNRRTREMKFSPGGIAMQQPVRSPRLKWEKWDGLWLTLPRPAGLIYFKPPRTKTRGRMVGNAVVGSDRKAFALECPRAAAHCGFLSQKNKECQRF
jgi:hypothetical protein